MDESGEIEATSSEDFSSRSVEAAIRSTIIAPLAACCFAIVAPFVILEEAVRQIGPQLATVVTTVLSAAAGIGLGLLIGAVILALGYELVLAWLGEAAAAQEETS